MKRNKKRIISAITMIILIIGMINIASADSNFNIYINDIPVVFTEDLGNPEIVNSRTMVPIRVVLENMGYKLDWNEALKKVTIYDSKTTVEFNLGESFALVNGVRTPMDIQDGLEIDTKSYIKNSRTMVPLRFITEAFGAQVDYNMTNGTHVINIYNISSDPLPLPLPEPPIITPPIGEPEKENPNKNSFDA